MTRCYACDSEVPEDCYGVLMGYALQPHPGAGPLWICRVGRYPQRPKAKCLRLAAERLLDVCAACGARGRRLCAECEAKLRATDELLSAEADRATFRIPSWHPKVGRGLTRLLAAVLAPVVERTSLSQLGRSAEILPGFDNGRRAHTPCTSDVLVSTTRRQAEAAGELLDAFGAYAAEARQEGLKQGRDALLSLARGETSSADFDAAGGGS